MRCPSLLSFNLFAAFAATYSAFKIVGSERSVHFSSQSILSTEICSARRATNQFSQLEACTEVEMSFAISNVLLGDMLDVIRLANDQFIQSTDNIVDIVKLDFAILNLFLPKLIFPRIMEHSVIGIRSLNDKKLVGFVDLSLQLSTGSLDALKPKSLVERQKQYGANNLSPYLCNLFVSPGNRKKGLARKLIAACEAEALRWGCNCINLHVEMSSAPALNLYLTSDFQIIKTAQDDVVFMTKKLF